MLGGPELTIILVIVLVLFGGSQLPKLARNLGRAQKEFKDGLDEASKDPENATPGGEAPTDTEAADGDEDSTSGRAGDAGDVNPSN